MKLKLKEKLLFLGILLFAGLLRFYGLNWDQGYHLHPDERFLTMVANAMQFPNSFTDYLNPALSTFNPANVGFSFFVYGAFPLILSKIFAVFSANDTYNTFTLLGRILSSFADLLVVFLIFKTVLLFEKHYKLPKNIKFLAAFFYSISVLPIQLSHFFAVDSFLNFFVFASFYFKVKFYFETRIHLLIISAFFLGLAIASKITAIFVVPLLLLIILPNKFSKKIFSFFNIKRTLLLSLVFIFTCYLTLRIADPYLFQTSNFFDLKPNTLFMQNLKSLKDLSDPNVWYPPNLQWLNKMPIIFALQNIVFFGVGIPLFLASTIGIFVVLTRFQKTKLLLIFIWCLLLFLYQSTQITKTMRYFITLYPFFTIFAGIGFYFISQYVNKILTIFYFIIILIWPLSFMSIYAKIHSRVEASNWIYQTIPSNSVILTEYWDDALPLQMTRKNKSYTIKEMPVFDYDTPDKWNKINLYLSQGDYLILSSNRGWGSIMQAPEKYPLMAKFYNDLLAEKLQYKMIKTFTSYPSFNYLNILLEFNDDVAEEAFTVYDHPKVMIFKKVR
ncbi:glycosyltransferase family 39 protein [Candidatus Roizmanbacteria bacterium]|nr:glycosyltransferase family 39 protein [Candidatus Roizmanbacteria bacterium]